MDIAEGQFASKPERLHPAVFVKVEDLAPLTCGHNLHLKVVEKRSVLEKDSVFGAKLCVAEILVGDETGCVLLTAKNDQIALLQEESSVTVRNSKVELFNGHVRLAVDEWGLIEPAQDEVKDVNLSKNLSEIDMSATAAAPNGGS